MKKISSMVVFAYLLFGWAAFASAYSHFVGFGDSISDTGNIGRFSDGDIWLEKLATHFSGSLHGFAYGGATTGYDNPAASLPITGLQWQVETYKPVVENLPSADTLVSVWAGGNDFLQSRGFDDAVFNIGSVLEELYEAGSRNFLVPNLPDIGRTPAILGEQMASDWTAGFNSGLDRMLQEFRCNHTDITLIPLDIFTLFNQFEVGSDEWASLFWVDGFHPSSRGHEIIYQAAVAGIKPVPEPATMVLFSLGITGLAGMRRLTQKLH